MHSLCFIESLKGGESVTEGILLASSDTVDMIKGLFKYEVFVQEV